MNNLRPQVTRLLPAAVTAPYLLRFLRLHPLCNSLAWRVQGASPPPGIGDARRVLPKDSCASAEGIPHVLAVCCSLLVGKRAQIRVFGLGCLNIQAVLISSVYV